MRLRMLRAKIHGATVTDADLAYEGSVTIDRAITAAVGVVPYEAVQIWSLTSGERLETYVLEGEEGSGTVCINGAAAHKIKKGEKIILASFGDVDEADAEKHLPSVVFLDERNRVKRSERAARTERRISEKISAHSGTAPPGP